MHYGKKGLGMQSTSGEATKIKMKDGGSTSCQDNS